MLKILSVFRTTVSIDIIYVGKIATISAPKAQVTSWKMGWKDCKKQKTKKSVVILSFLLTTGKLYP